MVAGQSVATMLYLMGWQLHASKLRGLVNDGVCARKRASTLHRRASPAFASLRVPFAERTGRFHPLPNPLPSMERGFFVGTWKKKRGMLLASPFWALAVDRLWRDQRRGAA